MSDSEIIWKFLDREFLDDNPLIYLYCNGNVRTTKTATTKIVELTNKVFHPAMSTNLIQTVIIEFLENKKKFYINGVIQIKPIYNGL
jgi:hypothetical protein